MTAKKWTAKELREKYLEFFKERGHAILPSAPLIPENDPTVLFTTAGMHPLVPFLLGESHPSGKRLVSVQKCIRTGDIEEVGDNWHLTFFEMLGNWSLGDYFKEEVMKWSWEFLTDKKYLGLDKKNLAVSVFAGDSDAPFDEEAYKIWQDLGVPKERVAQLPKEDNWWGPAGKTGPCGPDTEMFYWVGGREAPEKFDPQDKNWVEIWNDVFMQYNKTAEGKYEPLAQKNIDTGMGLERTIGVLNGCKNVYETEVFAPLVAEIKKMATADPDEKSVRIIADHIRAATFILGDPVGVVPSNVGQGYILRRLIRRAIRYAKKIDIDISKSFTASLAEIVIGIYGKQYPELLKNKEKILGEPQKEEKKFDKALENGLREFKKYLEEWTQYKGGEEVGRKRVLSGEATFKFYETYGFPLELIREIAAEYGAEIDEKDFEAASKKHQELSRTASAGQFKGGLADSSDEVKRLHTAAHLMLAALRQVLGEHVEQRGSNITAERLRFDFSHSQKMTPEEIKKVEDLVNEQIKKNVPIVCEITTVDEAKKSGAAGIFGSKYGEKVKVYSAGDFSKEICGGPHAENTGELGSFKIIKEEASSAGIRRIKAILEH
ncbi:MAG: alanine--tRNA ligase [Patescibacteria group bacterium]